MHRTQAAIRNAVAVALMGVLGACQSQYRVELSNESGRTAVATVVRGGAFDGDRKIASKAVPNEGSVELGPFEGTGMDGLRISVSRPGDLGSLPTEQRLRRGYNAFVIEAAGVDSWESVLLRRVE